jgi:uncharacterized protein YbjT (DUF2867 family)
MGRTVNNKPSAGPAFIAGATGYTGREVVRVLTEAGVPAVAHVRPDSPRLAEWKERFEKMGAAVNTTAWEESAMAASLAAIKPCYVFALLGTVRARMKQAAREGADPGSMSYETVDYGLTALLVRAAAGSKTTPRFVYLSAMGAQGKNPTAYYKARRKAEKAVMESGLPYTIARPSFITGPDRDDKRPGERVGALVADTFLSAVAILDSGKMRDRFGSISNTMLARALVALAQDKSAANGIFESEQLKHIARQFYLQES